MGNESYGARWWRFDFHTHSPASYDYGKGPNREKLKGRSPRRWLLDFMDAGIECVAITDHNTAGWIDKLQREYAALRQERPDGFRDLYLFPGVEITVFGGAHLLAIFDPATTGKKVVQLLTEIGFPSDPEELRSLCTKDSFPRVAEAIVKHGGIPIPAHIDSTHGVLETYSGQTLQQILTVDSIIAAEVSTPQPMQFGPLSPPSTEWTPLLGSDTHHPSGQPGQSYPGSQFTWIKMGHPSIEGLRLALLDGASLSVRRSVDHPEDPNAHANLVAKSVAITEARHAGRGTPLRVAFSPWMTSIIGGRGTGKSTILEMMRLCLRRENELPAELQDDLGRFARIAPTRNSLGGLTEATKLTVEMEKGGDRFRVLWSSRGDGPVIQRLDDNGRWRNSPGEVRTRFPVRIFSQKQVLALASHPETLLDLVDESRDVDGPTLKAQRDKLETRYLSIQSELRALQSRLKIRDRISGELDDLNRRIQLIEESDYRDLLVSYRRAQRQIATFRSRQKELKQAANQIRSAAAEVEPSDLDGRDFDQSHPDELEALRSLQIATEGQHESASKLLHIAAEIDHITSTLSQTFKQSTLQSNITKVATSYNSLIDNLQKFSVTDPRDFSSLIQRRQITLGQISELDQIQKQVYSLEKRAHDTLDELTTLRLHLSNQRTKFLNRILVDNEYVRITVVPFGVDASSQESVFRRAIAKEDDRLRTDILDRDGSRGILAELYQNLPEPPCGDRTTQIQLRVQRTKEELLAESKGSSITNRTEWFRRHIRSLPAEQIDRIQLWWPDDSLLIKYRRPRSSKWAQLDGGSPGQKSAALLAFLLSYGEEPLILDQPEDDLDNHLIYDLIVKQIRNNKRRRQVIVATHNPNIVVNADAEQVIAMDFRAGQCIVSHDGTGCLQEMEVRDEICRVMEGGREAFNARHERLVMEG